MPQIHDRQEYRAFPALNQSAAKKLLVSPAHYQAYMNTPHEETKALRFGTFVHAAILEPHTLNDLYATAPDVDKRTKQGKEDWAASPRLTPARPSSTRKSPPLATSSHRMRRWR